MKEVQNALKPIFNTNISELSFEDLQSLSTLLIQQQLQMIAKKVTEVEDQFTKKIRKLEKKQEAQADMYVNALRAREVKEGWVNLTEFGTLFNVTISRVRVAKLLRIVGIAIKNARTTVAKREYMGDGRLCTTFITMNGHAQKLWNFRRCMNHIDEWLKEHGHYEEFYSKETEEDLQRFIDKLYEKYVLNEGVSV